MSRFLGLCARYIVALAFLASAVGKVLSPSQFEVFVRSLDWTWLPDVKLVLYLAVGAELGIVILLLARPMVVLGGLAAFGLLMVFSLILMGVAQSEVDVDCGCFGEWLGHEPVEFSILRNFVLLALSALIVYSGGPTRTES